MNHPAIYYFIFAVSGFSGLIYESIWTHYLKLFLGHAAYAQTLVLAIFMGGMALGAALCSRYSRNWRNLLLYYAIVEGIIGFCALIYHPLFDAGINYAYAAIIPSIGSREGVNLFKWVLSTLSILPQSILLGMTFPLMSGAFLRLFPERSGNSLAMLYFTNSIGAVFGVLASGFVLIKAFGFPGTIQIAGIINLAVAGAVWFLSRDSGKEPAAAPVDMMHKQLSATPQSSYLLLLTVSLGTGAASFIYEIGWIRMLAHVLGSSTHAFELMLSAFLLGLSFGGLWIKRRIDFLANPVRVLAIIQIVMGLLALATLPLYDGTFGIMQWLLKTLPKTDSGYLLFNLGSYGIAAIIMLPATFCAGMTLPLITNILFGQGHGEKSVGAVYAANTVGAIIGVFGAVHLGMPLLGLKGLMTCGVAIDMALGILLIWRVNAQEQNRQTPAMVTVGCVAAVLLVIALVRLDTNKMVSGVYRYTGAGILTAETGSLLFNRDGKTSTVSVVTMKNGDTSIRNNGKSDSSIFLDPDGPVSGDEPTTVLSGALPMMFKSDAQFVAIIGLGTGLTTQTLLSNPKIKHVDTIEIEPAVVEGARQFRSRNDLVFSDKRSRIIIDDAKSVFSSYGQKYDIIISEPSNPWVSGVASLFSEEFYRHVNRYLSDDGIFVQWIQLYEMDMNLMVSVLKALSANFSDYTIYLAGDNADIMVVAKKKGRLGIPNKDLLSMPTMQPILSRISVNGLQDLKIREVGSKQYLDPLLKTYAIKANSDYFPVLDQLAVKARFMTTGAYPILRLATSPIPVMHLLHADPQYPPLSTVTATQGCTMTLFAKRAVIVREYLLKGGAGAVGLDNEEIVSPATREAAINLRRIMQDCRLFPETERKSQLLTSAVVMIPYLTADELAPVWNAVDSGQCSDLTPLEKEYLNFYRALSRRDFKTVANAISQLIVADVSLDPNAKIYLAAMGMVAAIAQEDRARSLWFYRQVFTEQEQSDLSIQLLYANSL